MNTQSCFYSRKLDSHRLLLLFSGVITMLMVWSLSTIAYGQSLPIAYQHADFAGAAMVLSEGAYPMVGLNDEISSLVVPAGWRVTLFEHNEGGTPAGRARSFTRDTSYIGDDMNDRASFFTVERNEVTAFQNSHYWGTSQTYAFGGHADVGEVGNDQISSLRIPRGAVVTLYEHSLPTPSGRRRSYLTGTSYVGDAMNDMASYLKVGEASDFPVRSVLVRIRTGGDDLRCNSRAYGVVGLRNGEVVRVLLNGPAGWPNNSTRTVYLGMPAGTNLSDLVSFGIQFESGRCASTDTGDNWNIDALDVEFISSEGNGTLLSRSGSPFLRLTEDGLREWSDDTLVSAALECNYVHVADAGNTLRHMTLLDHPRANNNPNAIISVTPNWNPNGQTAGVYYNHAFGVWYNGSRWAIFSQDFAAMPNGATFNVRVAEAGNANEFIHRATSENIASTYTIINHPAANGNANARLIVTQRWTGIYNNQHIAVWYDTSQARWVIYNQQPHASMPVGATFNVIVAPDATATDVVHHATSANILRNWTVLDHPLLNGKPRAVMLVTPNFNPGGVYAGPQNRAIGVWYDGSRWAIFNQDSAALTPGTAFNVKILND